MLQRLLHQILTCELVTINSKICTGPNFNQFDIQDRPISEGQTRPSVDVRVVSANYFETIRQPIVKGRSLTPHDTEPNSPPVAIINQSLARHFWPNEEAVGKRLSFDNRQSWTEIVGIAGDVKEYGLDHAPGDQIYLAFRNNFVGRLVARTSLDPRNVGPLLRAAIHEIDPFIAVDKIETVERDEYDSMASPRVMTFLLGIFAGLAVLISASGIAAVMALAVSQRTREIGVRMALGAQRGSVVGMVMKHGLVMALGGIAAGIGGAVLLTRLLSTFLYGTSATDVPTFAAVVLLFLAIASLACFVPARQVTAIDPLLALRQE